VLSAAQLLIQRNASESSAGEGTGQRSWLPLREAVATNSLSSADWQLLAGATMHDDDDAQHAGVDRRSICQAPVDCLHKQGVAEESLSVACNYLGSVRPAYRRYLWTKGNQHRLLDLEHMSGRQKMTPSSRDLLPAIADGELHQQSIGPRGS
jgi:hypothetical protein